MRLWLCAALLLTACGSNRIVLDPQWKPGRKPDYQDHFDYYALGFIGDGSADLQKVCMEQTPRAAEQLRTIEDGIISLYTLGVYTPVTVRVWCE